MDITILLGVLLVLFAVGSIVRFVIKKVAHNTSVFWIIVISEVIPFIYFIIYYPKMLFLYLLGALVVAYVFFQLENKDKNNTPIKKKK